PGPRAQKRCSLRAVPRSCAIASGPPRRSGTSRRHGALVAKRIRADRAHIDLIVLDLRLPDASGVDLVRTIPRIDEVALPILVFSGTIASADEVRELAAPGIAGYVDEYSPRADPVPPAGRQAGRRGRGARRVERSRHRHGPAVLATKAGLLRGFVTSRHVARSRRSAFATTMSDAPVSASTAIQS